MQESYLSNAMLPLLMTVVLGYYAARLLVFHDPEAVMGKKAADIKDKENYSKEAGKLMIFMGVGSLLMAVLMYFNVYVAVAEIIAWFAVFGVFWKKMNDKYGYTQPADKPSGKNKK